MFFGSMGYYRDLAVKVLELRNSFSEWHEARAAARRRCHTIQSPVRCCRGGDGSSPFRDPTGPVLFGDKPSVPLACYTENLWP